MTTTPAPLEGIILSDQPDAQLVTVQNRPTLEIFTTEGLVPALVQHVRWAALSNFNPDLTTDKGRKEIASRAFRVAKAKTYLDDLGKEEVARLKELPKAVDAGRKAMRDALDALRDEIRKPLTQWEEQREQLKAQIAAIQNLPARLMACGSGQIRREIQALENWSTDAETWQEFTAEAEAVKRVTLLTLEEMAEKAQKREDDAAELERLRAEKAERDRLDREEQLRKEGEERARKAAEAAAQAPAPAPAADPLPPQAPAPAANPLNMAKLDTQAAADVEHRRTYNREALEDLMHAIETQRDTDNTFTKDLATAVLRAIAFGKVRHVSITY